MCPGLASSGFFRREYIASSFGRCFFGKKSGEKYLSGQMSEVNFTHFSSIEHFPPCSSSPVSQSKQNLDVKDLHEAAFKETYLSYTIKATGKWRSKGAWMHDLCSFGSVCLATFCNKKIASPATFTDLRTTQILNCRAQREVQTDE